jgi:hypothetical protein
MSSAQPLAGKGFSSATRAMNIRKKAMQPAGCPATPIIPVGPFMPSRLRVPVAW